MTKLVVLTLSEKRRFESLPSFLPDERVLYFSLNTQEKKIIEKIRTPTNKVGFVLQLGYFKATAKFFNTTQFTKQDIEYVTHILGISREDVNISSYQMKTPIRHRNLILQLLGWSPFNNNEQEKMLKYIHGLAEKQLSPKNIFFSVIDYCWQNNIELPSYNSLTMSIAQGYTYFESQMFQIISTKLTPAHCKKLNELTGLNGNKNQMQRSPLTLFKQINQSLRPMDIQENIKNFHIFEAYFNEFKAIIDELKLSESATEYFATWVQKSTIFQLNQFHNRNKLYLYLLCYIKHYFYYRQDILADIFLKSTQSTINAANAELNQHEKNTRSERNKAIRKLSAANKDSREIIEKITEIVKSPTLLNNEKLIQIESLIDQYHFTHDISEKHQLTQLELSLDKIIKNQTLFDVLESFSLKLQRRVSGILKVLKFNSENSDEKLLAAICHFQSNEGEITQEPPFDFLSTQEKEALFSEGKLRISLYKSLLFIHVADAIKSGRLNLLYSYRYKAIHEYLIDEVAWNKNRQNLLSQAGLLHFLNFNTVIDQLKQQLEKKYHNVNERFLNGENAYLTVDHTGKLKLSTPKTDSDTSEFIPSLLSRSGYIPILQIFSDINQITQFTSTFKHFSSRYKKMKPESETVFAGLLGKGCNIGVDRIAHISKGVSEDRLKNTVNWFFSLKNLQAANNKILAVLSKLFLANNYRKDDAELHTGSDGRKVNVAVDSLMASYSYKYFGKGKGVTIYTFLDERQLLFHLLVMSASEREAAYVIDGLLQNEVIKSDIHSTDTHGFTETIFAATHFIDTAFAPRIKNISDQNIYAFSARQTYENRGYKILPSRTINVNLIEKHWDDILRFMVTLKLKNTTASQLFKRLSSYAKDHPLYQALKEFGRVIKSIFILTYYDDVTLRQRIEKQLNKVELSNKFSKAVFFANNQEFRQGTKEEQEITAACMALIQNAILLWNYLYVSQLATQTENKKERDQLIHLIKKGSMMVWRHINLQGEYDFTQTAANDFPFDMEKIWALRAA